METFDIKDLGKTGERKGKIEDLQSALIQQSDKSDLSFILVAYSENENINIIAGSGKKHKLKNLNKQVKKYINQL